MAPVEKPEVGFGHELRAGLPRAHDVTNVMAIAQRIPGADRGAHHRAVDEHPLAVEEEEIRALDHEDVRVWVDEEGACLGPVVEVLGSVQQHVATAVYFGADGHVPAAVVGEHFRVARVRVDGRDDGAVLLKVDTVGRGGQHLSLELAVLVIDAVDPAVARIERIQRAIVDDSGTGPDAVGVIGPGITRR